MKEIPKFEGYFATREGKIFSRLKSSKNKNIELKELSPANNGRGYLQVSLHKEGKNYSKYVHRLIYSAYFEEIPNNMQIDHIDGDKRNNRLSNLRLCTRRENCQFQNKTINNSSGEHNIFFDKTKNKYRVTFRIERKSKNFGTFENLLDAILRRNEINKELSK